jgi:hypothetical protein
VLKAAAGARHAPSTRSARRALNARTVGTLRAHRQALPHPQQHTRKACDPASASGIRKVTQRIPAGDEHDGANLEQPASGVSRWPPSPCPAGMTGVADVIVMAGQWMRCSRARRPARHAACASLLIVRAGRRAPGQFLRPLQRAEHTGLKNGLVASAASDLAGQ